MPLFSALKKMVDTRYEAQAATNCNTCNVGAWVIGHEHYLLEKSGGLSMRELFNRITGKRNSAPAVIPTVTEAPRCERQQCKILVVCKGYSFSRGIADYAINMAKKTRSSLVALNLDESGRDFTGFEAEAKRHIEYFSCKAADANLSFCHEIRQGDEDTVVAQMHESDPQFKYVMDDSAVVSKSRSSIPVYTRATLRAK